MREMSHGRGGVEGWDTPELRRGRRGTGVHRRRGQLCSRPAAPAGAPAPSAKSSLPRWRAGGRAPHAHRHLRVRGGQSRPRSQAAAPGRLLRTGRLDALDSVALEQPWRSAST